MVEKNKLIDELKKLGFNDYKAKVFAVLSSGKVMTASEIVSEAKIIRGSIYDILKSFVKSGYCNEIETNRILHFRMIDPDVVLDKLVKENVLKQQDYLLQLKNTFRLVRSHYDENKNSVSKEINIEIIRGHNRHRISKYKELLLTAKKEICGMYMFKGMVSDEADELTKNFIKRGGKIRSIYRAGLDFKVLREGKQSAGTNEDLINICKSYESYGEDLRITESDIPNITIVDSISVFLNIDGITNPGKSEADVIFKKSTFAKYMQELFVFYWKESCTIKDYELSLKNKKNIKSIPNEK